ncbi:hypothetical protein ACOSQ2_021109 [Xanthoceras sorbifolium]
MSTFSSLIKFDVEKFDGRINFGLWQVQVKDMLIQSRLHKVLKGKPTPISNSDYGESNTILVTKNGSNWKKKNSEMNTVCWGCEQSGHVKKNCYQGGGGSTKGSESDVGSVSLLMGDSDFL